MTKRDDPKHFLPENRLDKGSPSNEISPDPRPVEYNKIPNPLDPMGQIETEGLMFRTLLTGRVAWWVLVIAWITFGGPALLLLYVGLTSLSLGALPILVISVAFLIILCRSTVAKLSRRNYRRR
jgi:hypothetical protein